MAFDYSKLRGRIVEKCGTMGNFCDRMGISRSTIGCRFSGEYSWRQSDIVKACEILDIEKCSIPTYFFDECVVKSPTKGSEK